MNPISKLKNKVIRQYAHVYSNSYSFIQNSLIRLSKNLDKPLNRPTMVTIVVTSNCMLRCRQCDLWKSVPEKQMTFEDAVKIIDKLHSWLGNFYLFFTGGEPFINQDLPQIIRYAEDKGIMTHVNSNAFVFNEKLAKKIVNSHLSSISISLDGGNALVHDHLRGVKGAFERVKIGIENLQKQRKEAKINTPRIYINSVIMKPNVHQLGKIVNVAQKYGTDGLTFQNLLPTLYTSKTTYDLLKDPLWPDFPKLKKSIQKVIKDFSAQKILLTTKEQLRYAIRYYKNPHITDKIQCAAGINNFIVTHEGNVKLCFSYPTVGNIFADDPAKIWHNSATVKQRSVIRKCRQPCKMTACNRIDTQRQKDVILRAFESHLTQDLPRTP